MRAQKRTLYCLLPVYSSVWIFSTFFTLPLPCFLSLSKSFKFGLTASVNFNYGQYTIRLILCHQSYTTSICYTHIMELAKENSQPLSFSLTPSDDFFERISRLCPLSLLSMCFFFGDDIKHLRSIFAMN